MSYQNYLISDPRSSLRAGDVVKIAAERQVSRHIKHVVTEIVVPWGPSIEERPPVMSEEERMAIWRGKKEAKMERQKARETGATGESRQEERTVTSS